MIIRLASRGNEARIALQKGVGVAPDQGGGGVHVHPGVLGVGHEVGLFGRHGGLEHGGGGVLEVGADVAPEGFVDHAFEGLDAGPVGGAVGAVGVFGVHAGERVHHLAVDKA